MRDITKYNILKRMKFTLLIGFCVVLAIGVLSCGDEASDDGNTEPVIDAFHMRLEQAVVNYEGPIFDWHQHLPFFQNKNVYIRQLFSEMNSLGVSCGVLMASATDASGPANYAAVFSLQEAQKLYNIAVGYPATFIPFFGGFDPTDSASIGIVQNQLATKNWKGIGELQLRSRVYEKQIPASHPVMMAIYNLAAQYGVPVHLHYRPDYGTPYLAGLGELEDALATNPNTIFVWGHRWHHSGAEGGLRSEVRRLLNIYPNLYLQWAFSFPPETVPNFLTDLHNYSDRLIFGTDVGMLEEQQAVVESGGATFYQLIDNVRAVLGMLSSADAENIAFRNAEKLLGPCIRRGLTDRN